MIPLRVYTPKIARNSSGPKLLQPAATEIANLHLVAPGIIRGIKTIINLRNEEVIVNREAADAQNLGLNFINIPMDVFAAPSVVAIKTFIEIIEDRRNLPVFIHCQHGLERTGTMIGLYRIHQEGWSGGQAYDEMLKHGFRPAFFNLSLTVMDYSNEKQNQATSADAPRRSAHSHSVMHLLGRTKRLASQLFNLFMRLHQIRKDPIEYGPEAVLRV
jgi:protein tyrosine phosphatase (PTP) superfamily phosphohydrolase (DUF442 family)